MFDPNNQRSTVLANLRDETDDKGPMAIMADSTIDLLGWSTAVGIGPVACFHGVLLPIAQHRFSAGQTQLCYCPGCTALAMRGSYT